MQKDPFTTLGVSENVSQNELYEAYRKLRDKYIDKRFAPGQEGTEACEKLDEIEAAYREADRIIQNRYYVSDARGKDVEDLIRRGKIDEAQDELDRIQTRDAEWHFLQSMVFYRKRWYNEAKEQLKTAMEMDPDNAKYSDAYHNLNARMNINTEGRRDSFYSGNQGGRSYRDTPADGGARHSGCTACDCCTSLVCADCCCECMGGDLISCC